MLPRRAGLARVQPPGASRLPTGAGDSPCPAAAPAPSPGRAACQRPHRHVAPRRPLPPRPRRPPAPLPGTARHIRRPPHLAAVAKLLTSPAAADPLAPSRLPLLLRAGRGARSRAGAPDRLRRSGAGGASEAPRLTKLRHGCRGPIYSAAASLWQRTSSNQPRSAGTGRAPTAAIVTYGRTCARRPPPGPPRPTRLGPCPAPAPARPRPCRACRASARAVSLPGPFPRGAARDGIHLRGDVRDPSAAGCQQVHGPRRPRRRFPTPWSVPQP